MTKPRSEQTAQLLAERTCFCLSSNYLFALRLVKRPSLGLAIMARFSKGNWASLTDLSLIDCGLGAQGISHLVRTHCPKLQRLNLYQYGLDAEASWCATGTWTCLTELRLGSNPKFDAQAMAHLATASWPLQKLLLNQCDWPAAAMSSLATASWTAIQYLKLSRNTLDAGAMRHLVAAKLPMLGKLELTRAGIDAAGALWLALVCWPLLEDLQLSYNCLDATAMRYLAKGAWPLLWSLKLAGNRCGRCGVRELTYGSWHQLRFLHLPLRMLRGLSATVLDLNSELVSQLRRDAQTRNVYVTRKVRDGDPWQSLDRVLVSCYPNGNASFAATRCNLGA